MDSMYQMFINLIGQPQNYVILPSGNYAMIYDTAFITRAILLILTFVFIYGILINCIKAMVKK